ncbi:MAG TPA: cyclic nucleotide-binding domain-containing protein [Actinomycetota bacterium]|nr:cyclic nucleotide-binding domain-containing protein [Actinomycetota bacterium]
MGPLSSSKLTRLSEKEWSFDDGSYLFREGESGTEMFVIQEGTIEVTKQAGTQEIHLATLGRGDFLGEMSLLEGLPRDASARAVGPTRVLAIGQGGLLMRIRRDPTFALELLNCLSARVRELNAQVMKVTQASSPPGSREP